MARASEIQSVDLLWQNLFLAADSQSVATHVKQPTCWPQLGAICCCIRTFGRWVPFGVLYGKEEDKSAPERSLQTAPSGYYKKLNRWLLFPGSCVWWSQAIIYFSLDCPAGKSTFKMNILRWIMQEMLWSIRPEDRGKSPRSVYGLISG